MKNDEKTGTDLKKSNPNLNIIKDNLKAETFPRSEQTGADQKPIEEGPEEALARIRSLLARASQEIKELRYINQILSAKVEAFDTCILLLHAQAPRRDMNQGPDLTMMIDHQVSILHPENVAKAAQ